MAKLIICSRCKRERKHMAKGLCCSCYKKQWLKNSPDAKRKHLISIRKWQSENKEKVREAARNYYWRNKDKWKQRYLNFPSYRLYRTNDKSNINSREGQFAEHLESQGKSWAYEPIRFKLKNTTYKPDFYCPENNTFYEVVGTRQAINQIKEKVKELIEMFPKINIEIVKPNGNKYKFYGEKIKMKGKTKTIMLKIQESSWKELMKIAEKECRTMSSVVRQAIREYLEKI